MTEEYLKKAIAANRLPHACILVCEDPERRSLAAGEIALVLLCESQDPPCRKCHACRQVLAGTNPDLIRVTHEKPQTISVGDVRTQISETVGVRPYASRRKVYLLDDAELMTPQAQNALLKTIEEPPEYAVLILLTSNEKMLLETIRSRCVVLKLESGRETDTDSPQFREDVELLTGLADRDAEQLAADIARIRDRGPDGMRRFLEFARSWLRDLLLYKRTGSTEMLLFAGEAEKIRRQASEYDLVRLERALEAVDRAEDRLRYNVNAELSIQLMLLSL